MILIVFRPILVKTSLNLFKAVAPTRPVWENWMLVQILYHFYIQRYLYILGFFLFFILFIYFHDDDNNYYYCVHWLKFRYQSQWNVPFLFITNLRTSIRIIAGMENFALLYFLSCTLSAISINYDLIFLHITRADLICNFSPSPFRSYQTTCFTLSSLCRSLLYGLDNIQNRGC